jgi:hypothetical protein
MARSSYADHVTHWIQLEVKVESDVDLAFLEEKRSKLATERAGLQGALNRQSTAKALFHQATRDLEDHLARGNAAAIELHDSIRGHYGRTGEKLNDFRLQPRRPRRSTPKPPPVEIKKPSEPGPTPVQTATPATDAST